MSRVRRDVERLRECRRCKGTNTDEIGSSDDHWKFTYVGWCHDCHDEYGYACWIETIWDRQGRV